MSGYLSWLADACRETGYPVVEVSGWQSRGHGPMTAGHGVVGHWTAGPARSGTSSNTPSLSVVINGRTDLPGPLCGVYTAFDGTLYVVAAGLAYHAGASAWHGDVDLNDTFVGNEVESPGDFVYTPAQLDVTPRLHAAVLRRMARTADWSCAHYECATPAGRKPDGPARNMAAFRAQVAGYLANPATITKEDDMADVPQGEWDDVHRWTGAIGQRIPTDTPTQLQDLGARTSVLDRRTLFLQAQQEQLMTWLGVPPVEYRPDGNYPPPVPPA